MAERDDRDLVSRCKQRERRAFEELVQRYQDVVYRVAYRMLGDADDAEDLTQTVFLKVAERIDDYDPKYKFFSWIYRIAVNECLNQRREERAEDRLEESRIAGGAAADELFIQDETNAGLQRAIMKLSEEYRAVVILRHFEGLSYEEISGVLKIPEKTVKSRLFSARQQLRTMLLPTEKR